MKISPNPVNRPQQTYADMWRVGAVAGIIAAVGSFFVKGDPEALRSLILSCIFLGSATTLLILYFSTAALAREASRILEDLHGIVRLRFVQIAFACALCVFASAAMFAVRLNNLRADYLAKLAMAHQSREFVDSQQAWLHTMENSSKSLANYRYDSLDRLITSTAPSFLAEPTNLFSCSNLAWWDAPNSEIAWQNIPSPRDPRPDPDINLASFPVYNGIGEYEFQNAQRQIRELSAKLLIATKGAEFRNKSLNKSLTIAKLDAEYLTKDGYFLFIDKTGSPQLFEVDPNTMKLIPRVEGFYGNVSYEWNLARSKIGEWSVGLTLTPSEIDRSIRNSSYRFTEPAIDPDDLSLGTVGNLTFKAHWNPKGWHSDADWAHTLLNVDGVTNWGQTTDMVGNDYTVIWMPHRWNQSPTYLPAIPRR